MFISCENAVNPHFWLEFTADSQLNLRFLTESSSKLAEIKDIRGLQDFGVYQKHKGETNMSNKVNFILDATIFSSFLVVANPVLTGMTMHEWLALAFAAAILVHLLFHWKWLVTITKQFFKKLLHQSRLNYVIDALFFVSMTTAMFSGLMISKSIMTTLGIHLDVGRSWKTIHTLASDISLILLGLHFALHFKWVVNSLKRYIVSPVIGLFQRSRRGTLAAQPVRIDRNR